VGFVNQLFAMNLVRGSPTESAFAEIGARIGYPRFERSQKLFFGIGKFSLPEVDFSQGRVTGGQICGNRQSFLRGSFRFCNFAHP
jgi:hypothetical protein